MKKSKNPKPKKKAKPARLERRVRVTFFLVAEKEEAKEAVVDIILYLDAQYFHFTSEGKSELPVTGFTHSAIPFENSIPHEQILYYKNLGKGIFWGHWWQTEPGEVELIQERVVFFVVDLPAVAEEWKTDESITLIKDRIFHFYEMHDCPQEEIWIVKQDIYRYA